MSNLAALNPTTSGPPRSGKPNRPKISLIVTVFNEGESIHRLLQTIRGQSRRADELVICDGGSLDGTVDAIHAFAAAHAQDLPPVRVLVEPGANISRGRNTAIAAAHGPLIVATDAGVRLDPEWLERITRPWRMDRLPGEADPIAAAGFFLPDVDGLFQTAMAATVLPLVEDIDPAKFLPSSRSVAFTKEAWSAAGGYPEWLDYCEDLLFDFGINRQTPERPSGFDFVPDAVAYFRPRTGLRSFWTQYYRYARGDGKADLFRKRHAVRYVIYLVVLPILLALAFGGGGEWMGIWGVLLGWVGLLAGVIGYCRRPWQRLLHLGRGRLAAGQMVAAWLLVPGIRVVGDAAKMAGYPIGLIWRFRNRHRPEIHWR